MRVRIERDVEDRVIGIHPPTDTVIGINHDECDALFCECPGSFKPGDASANDDHIGIARKVCKGDRRQQ